MATTTSNLGLTKPDYSDPRDIAVINANMDILDSRVTDRNQGVANAGKFMVVNSSGYVEATTIPSANGGEF